MLHDWGVIAAAFGYIGFLFVVASYGDRLSPTQRGRASALIYPLSLAIYCTSWTFFGSVGSATRTGIDFLAIYVGPILMIAFCTPLLRRVIKLAKSQNITSIADFIAARYGKSQAVAATVAAIAIIGSVPYIALQLKAVAASLGTILEDQAFSSIPIIGDVALIVTLAMAAFAVLFGTRQTDATEHQHGLMLAIATESIVKLVAFIAVGAFVTFWMFSPVELIERAMKVPEAARAIEYTPSIGNFLTMTLLSFFAIMLLPRQFHVSVVENSSDAEVGRARWLFPLYLIAINLFVIPIALAGLVTFPFGAVEADMYVLALPMQANSPVLSVLVFVGGLSAATAMVIVESVALSIMISNGLVVPLLLRRRLQDYAQAEDLAGMLLNIRRIAICGIVFAGYLFYRTLGQVQGLAAIGLVSFAAIAQLAPAFFGGLVWGRATARGAIAGIVSGFVICSYTLMLPWFVKAGFLVPELLADGPFGVTWLRPQALFYLDLAPLTHGVLTSMTVNVLAFVGVSLTRQPFAAERSQAQLFVAQDLDPGTVGVVVPNARPHAFRSAVTVGDLQATATRYLGADRSQRSFADYALFVGRPLMSHSEADLATIQFTERLLSSAVGAASARLVMALLLSRAKVGSQETLQLLDVASEALHYNHDLLQSALDQVRHGLGVFDRDMRLICWNRQFGELLELPAGLTQVGVPLVEIVRYAAMRGDFGGGPIEHMIADRMYRLTATRETLQERVVSGVDRILEIRSATMPQGGIVITFADVTERVGRTKHWRATRRTWNAALPSGPAS